MVVVVVVVVVVVGYDRHSFIYGRLGWQGRLAS